MGLCTFAVGEDLLKQEQKMANLFGHVTKSVKSNRKNGIVESADHGGIWRNGSNRLAMEQITQRLLHHRAANF